MPSRPSPASDAPLEHPVTDICPTTEALKARLDRLRGGSRRVPSPPGCDGRHDHPSTPPPPNGSGLTAVPSRPGRSADPPSDLAELVALLAAGLRPIDLETDTLLSPGEVTELLPPRRRGRKAHRSTIFRWMKSGYRGLRLPFIQVGHQRCTSVNALQSFLAALTAISRFEQGDPAPAYSTTPVIQPDRPAREAKRHLRVEDDLQRRHGI